MESIELKTLYQKLIHLMGLIVDLTLLKKGSMNLNLKIDQ